MGMKLLDSTFFVMKRLGWVAVENRMFHHGDRVLVALSGGHASLAMLLALVHRQRKTPIDLEILPFHVPDGVYGPPVAVEPMLREACGRMGLELAVWDGGGAQPSGHFEAIPYREILLEQARRVGACSIALGHTLEDRAMGVLLPAVTRGRLSSVPEAEEIVGPGGADRPLRVLRLLSHVEPEAVLRMARDEGLPVLEPLVQGPLAELRKVVEGYLGAKSGPRIEKLRNLATAPDRVRDEYLA
jgi:tRNA(Ile)-lysidine synthase TilS/MesJ